MILKQAEPVLREEMGAEEWDALSNTEREELLRVHMFDCHQHMRNIFLKAMSTAQVAPPYPTSLLASLSHPTLPYLASPRTTPLLSIPGRARQGRAFPSPRPVHPV